MSESKTARVRLPRTSISTKDVKLLWGRAAARCSICKVLLSEALPDESGAVLYGNVCHIVGESSLAARGKSALTPKQRNSYPNLLIACGACHEKIDKNEQRWPIERLHDIKSLHEQWVSETLGDHFDAAVAIYAEVIDTLSIAIGLEEWDAISDFGTRALLPRKWIRARDIIERRFETVRWPKRHKRFERCARKVACAFVGYVDFFLEFSEPYGPHLVQADHSHAREHYPDHNLRQHYEHKEAIWELLCRSYLHRLARRLNAFAKEVRIHINPAFMIYVGRFMVHNFGSCAGSPVSLLTKRRLARRIKSQRARWTRLCELETRGV